MGTGSLEGNHYRLSALISASFLFSIENVQAEQTKEKDNETGKVWKWRLSTRIAILSSVFKRRLSTRIAILVSALPRRCKARKILKMLFIHWPSLPIFT